MKQRERQLLGLDPKRFMGSRYASLGAGYRPGYAESRDKESAAELTCSYEQLGQTRWCSGTHQPAGFGNATGLAQTL